MNARKVSLKVQSQTEETEQILFVQYCQMKGYRIHHCANEVGGSTMQLKLRAIKAKRMGTSKGFPDLLVFVPIYGITEEIDAYQPIAIEMKRRKGGVTSPEQKKWGEVLSMAGIPFRVCHGCDEAIEFVREVMDGQ
jgi:hypothetical protein